MSTKVYIPTASPIPDSLLFHPCDVSPAGKTDSSLVNGYIKNTSCVGKYKSVVNGLINYNRVLKEKESKNVK